MAVIGLPKRLFKFFPLGELGAVKKSAWYFAATNIHAAAARRPFRVRRLHAESKSSYLRDSGGDAACRLGGGNCSGVYGRAFIYVRA